MRDLTRLWETDELECDYFDCETGPEYHTHQTVEDAVVAFADSPLDAFEWAQLNAPLKVYVWIKVDEDGDDFSCELLGFVVLTRDRIISILQAYCPEWFEAAQ